MWRRRRRRVVLITLVGVDQKSRTRQGMILIVLLASLPQWYTYRRVDPVAV
jgi:hypothetical protein